MKKFLSIIILLCVGIAYGQDDPNTLKTKIAQLEKTIARQEIIIEKLKAKLEEQEKETKRLLALCRKNGIETNPKKIARQPKDDGIAKTFHWPFLEVGQIAYLQHNLEIIQIIDKQNAIVDFCWTMIPEKGRTADSYGSLYRCKTAWLKGISTANLVDGGYIETNKPLIVTGTKMYNTSLGGTKTIFLIETYEPSQDSNEPNQ